MNYPPVLPFSAFHQAVTIRIIHPKTSIRNEFRRCLLNTQWKLYDASSWSQAVKDSVRSPAGVIVCAEALLDADWKVVQRELGAAVDAPNLVVCADTPEVALWADVLHRGGYDVLPVPFLRHEVLRTSWLAWSAWKNRCDTMAQSQRITLERSATSVKQTARAAANAA